MMSWWFKKKTKEEKQPDLLFHLKFKISFPVKDCHVRSENLINIIIPAPTEEIARIKLEQYVKSKIELEVAIGSITEK